MLVQQSLPYSEFSCIGVIGSTAFNKRAQPLEGVRGSEAPIQPRKLAL